MESDAKASGRRIGDILSAGALWLESRKIEDARLQCEWLAAALLSSSRTELELALGREADEPFVSQMREGVRRLGGGAPVHHDAASILRRNEAGLHEGKNSLKGLF